MKQKSIQFLVLILFGWLAGGQLLAQKSPSADTRLTEWRDKQLSLFVHWGPVSRIGQEISWSRNAYGPARYDSLYRNFNPTRFNAREWVRMAKRNGFKQIVLTAKHHDGFCLWDTKSSPYNIMNAPFGRDVCKELAQAAHEEGLALGWYFSVGDWKDPDCRNPKTNARYVERMLTQVRELLTNYGPISLLWIDYDAWASPVQPKLVYELARRLQPRIVVNNRLEPFTPDESHCRLGPFGDYTTPENFVAGYGAVPWETCTNMGHQWAWKFGDSPRSLTECVQTLLRCIGGNGNLLFNIGPDSTGVFPASFVARTDEMGAWINRHADAIYKTRGGPYIPTNAYVSAYRDNTVYLYLLASQRDTVRLPALGATVKQARLLNGASVLVRQQPTALHLTLPASAPDSVATIVELTLDKPAASLPKIRPFSSSNALSYGKKARSSSALGPFLHDASAAIDDDPNTFWKLGRRTDVNFEAYYGKNLNFQNDTIRNLFQHSGWLEVDLGKPQTVARIAVQEFAIAKPVSKINAFSIAYEKAGKWILLTQETNMGNWSKKITPVTAQKFRLIIQDSEGYPGVREFQVFGEGGVAANK